MTAISYDVEQANPSSLHAITRFSLLALSFLGGFQIMVLEVCGFRALQTSLGSSVFVTGILFATIIVLLAAGFYFGATLTQLRSLRALLLVLLAACAYTQLSSAFLVDHIGEWVGTWSVRTHGIMPGILDVGLPALIISVWLYGPPVLAMSMISPCLIRLERELPSPIAAERSVSYITFSSAGSISGMVMASCFFVPLLGVRAAAGSGNAMLFTVVLFALLGTVRRSRRVLLAAAGLVVLAAQLPGAQSRQPQGLARARLVLAAPARSRDN